MKKTYSFLLTAGIALALAFTLSCSDGSGGNTGDYGGGLSLPAGNPNGISFVWEVVNYYKTGEYYTGDGVISLSVWYTEDTEDGRYKRDIDSIPAGSIQEGQVLLNLPGKSIMNKYLEEFGFCDYENEGDGWSESCRSTGTVPANLSTFFAENIVVDIPDRNRCKLSLHMANSGEIEILKGPYTSIGFIYASKSGRVNGTETYEYSESRYSRYVERNKTTIDMNLKEGWNNVYETIIMTETGDPDAYRITERDITYTTALPEDDTLEWGIRCYD